MLLLGRGAAVHRHLGQAGEVHVQADRSVEGVVDDLVGVAGGEDALGAGAEGEGSARAVLGELAVEDGQDAGGGAVVVQAAALAGDPAEQPDLVAGAGAQPVVPPGGGVVLDQVLPFGAVRGDGAGQADELGDGDRVFAGGLEEVLDGEDVAGDLEVALDGEGVGTEVVVGALFIVGVSSTDVSRAGGRCGGGRSSGEPKLRRHQQLQQQQRTWAALRNPRMGVRVAAEVTDMGTRRPGRRPDCQPNASFAAKVSSDPVAALGERFVQTDVGEVALHDTHLLRPNPNRRPVIEM